MNHLWKTEYTTEHVYTVEWVSGGTANCLHEFTIRYVWATGSGVQVPEACCMLCGFATRNVT